VEVRKKILFLAFLLRFIATGMRLTSGDEAKAKGWTIISMKNDWKRIFAGAGK
jgi:hypothetical protein